MLCKKLFKILTYKKQNTNAINLKIDLGNLLLIYKKAFQKFQNWSLRNVRIQKTIFYQNRIIPAVLNKNVRTGSGSFYRKIITLKT